MITGVLTNDTIQGHPRATCLVFFSSLKTLYDLCKSNEVIAKVFLFVSCAACICMQAFEMDPSCAGFTGKVQESLSSCSVQTVLHYFSVSLLLLRW